MLYSHLQLPIWMIGIYGIISTVLVVVPLITKPYDAAMGLVISLATGVPYYLIFVKKMLPMSAGAKYSRKFKHLMNPFCLLIRLCMFE